MRGLVGICMCRYPKDILRGLLWLGVRSHSFRASLLAYHTCSATSRDPETLDVMQQSFHTCLGLGRSLTACVACCSARYWPHRLPGAVFAASFFPLQPFACVCSLCRQQEGCCAATCLGRLRLLRWSPAHNSSWRRHTRSGCTQRQPHPLGN